MYLTHCTSLRTIFTTSSIDLRIHPIIIRVSFPANLLACNNPPFVSVTRYMFYPLAEANIWSDTIYIYTEKDHSSHSLLRSCFSAL